MHRPLALCAIAVSSAVVAAGDTEVTFAGGAEGVTLAGTLSVPASDDAPFPAVVLVTGSGPQDRDETVLGQKPFKAIADRLVAEGFAVLRYDDRGVAGSTGDFAAATTDDFAADAAAALDFVAGRVAVDPSRLAVLGHSEGGVVAAMLSSADPRFAEVKLAAAVLLTPSGVPGSLVLTDQATGMMRAMGAPEAMIGEIDTAHRAFMAIAADASATREQLVDAARELVLAQTAGQIREDQLAQAAEQAADQMASDWMTRFIEIDPAAFVRTARVPQLIMLGGRDLQVTPSLNAGPLAEAMATRNQPGSALMILQGKNHLLQNASTGLVPEYASIDHPISDEALDLIVGWLRARLSGGANR